MRRYYEAYDDRYRQAHEAGLQWFTDEASAMVEAAMQACGVTEQSSILELGCGEGRDARALMEKGYNVTATDISPEAIRYCREKMPQYAERFCVLDAVAEQPQERYDYVYAVAVLHMLVEDNDRAAFLRFVRASLKEDGAALLCMLGDGQVQRTSDVSTAFELQERIHAQTGKAVRVAGTSCRIVNADTLKAELAQAGLSIAELGFTVIEEYVIPGFLPQMMYAVVKAAKGDS